MYEKQMQSVEGSSTIDKIKQPMEDLVKESSANMQFTLRGKPHSWSLTESLIIYTNHACLAANHTQFEYLIAFFS